MIYSHCLGLRICWFDLGNLQIVTTHFFLENTKKTCCIMLHQPASPHCMGFWNITGFSLRSMGFPKYESHDARSSVFLFCDLVVSDNSCSLKLRELPAGSFSELFRALTSGSSACGNWGFKKINDFYPICSMALKYFPTFTVPYFEAIHASKSTIHGWAMGTGSPTKGTMKPPPCGVCQWTLRFVRPGIRFLDIRMRFKLYILLEMTWNDILDSRWWFHFLFLPQNLGKMIQFDEHILVTSKRGGGWIFFANKNEV